MCCWSSSARSSDGLADFEMEGLEPGTRMSKEPSNDGISAGEHRPAALEVVIRETPALYAAYMSFIDGGGLFVATSRPARLGDEVELVVQLLDDPPALPVTGKVVWLTPAGTPGREQGIGVQFPKNEAGAHLRSRIRTLLCAAPSAGGPAQTI
jgi:type IV pilus assembly protein PilZ